MGEQHFNALSFAARLFERFSLGQSAGDIACLFIDAARDPAERGLWTASHLERAVPTVGCGRKIAKRLAIIDHCACRGQKLVCWTDIDVALFVEPEVFPAEGSILALRFVDDRDVRRYFLVFDEPVEGRA